MIDRYSSKRMKEIWSDLNRFRTWLKVEITVAEVMSEYGQIPLESLEEIKARADFDIDRIYEIEKETRHDVIAFLTALSEKVGSSSRFLHLGMTSSDLVDTSLSLLIKESVEIVLEKLDQVLDILKSRAVEFKYLPTVGRTHGIHGEPTTFGLKLARFYDELKRSKRRIKQALEEISIVKLSGAVGTYSSISFKIEKEVGKRLSLLDSNITTQVIPRDRHAELMTSFGILGSSIENIAVELRHLQRTEVLEVEEGFHKGQKGSSAMPHKKNPITAENLTGLARLLRSYSIASMENIPLWHERDISHSSVERIIIPDATTLAETMLIRLKTLIESLRVIPENMQKNLDLTKGLIYSQSILLLLVGKGLTREASYKIVQDSAMLCWESKEPLLDILYRNEEVKQLFPEFNELEKAADIGYYLGSVDMIFDKVFG